MEGHKQGTQPGLEGRSPLRVRHMSTCVEEEHPTWSTPKQQGKSLDTDDGFQTVHYCFTKHAPRGLELKDKWEGGDDLIPTAHP